jgi:ElaB/YqjD/DUF883 family membrane-anchored ribosome-binding protein
METGTMKSATQNAAATRNTTASAVIKQTTDAANAVSPNTNHAKTKGQRRSKVIAEVNAKAIAKKPSADVQQVVVEIPSELQAKAAKAAKRYVAIKATQTKQLVELKDIGAIILELRSLYPSDKQFGKEVENTPFGVISRQERYDLMKLAEFWDGIQSAIADETIKPSTSPTLLVRSYSALLKDTGNTDKVGRNAAKGKTKQAAKAAKKSATSAKQKATDETSTVVKFTEQSVAQDLYVLITKHNLDADVIFDKLHDLIDSAKAEKH